MFSSPLLATVLLDPPSALLAGAVVALISLRLLRKDPDRQVLRTGAYGAAWGLLYGIAVGYPFFTYPDWMLVYLVDSAGGALWLWYLVFVVSLVASGAAGGLACGFLFAQQKLGLGIGLTGGAAVTLGGVALLTAPQYAVVGTTAEYLAGKAAPLATTGLPQVMLVTTLIAVVGSVVMLVVRIREVLKK